ncbi:MAG: 5'-deoxyadenosine deaminase [Bacillota bacterium]|nr:5'-deoxyadenosine deaminase [Bacillota bacterium]
MSSVLFRDAVIVTMDRERRIIKGNLLIEDDRIKEVNAVDDHADRVVDCCGRVLIPGLIQTHIHLVQALFRGQADDLSLLDWLRKKIWPLEAAHDADSIYYSAMLGIAELLRGGTTSIVDMATVNHTETLFEAIIESGIRAMSGKCMMDIGDDTPAGLSESTENSLTKSIQLLEKWHGRANNRLQYAFNPRFVLSCSEELLIQVRELASRYKVMIHSHASENRDEIALVEEILGRRNILYFDDIGLTGNNLILAHCIWVNDEELDILRRSGTVVAHCPSSNLKLGSGIAPIVQMSEMGINLSLGADGAPCNNNLDPFLEMRTAALIQKPIHGPTALPAEKVFEMATLGGAKAMNMSGEIGSIEQGMKADLVLLEMNRPHNMPSKGKSIYGRLVYETKSTDVYMTMVDGNILYYDDRLQTLDERNILKQSDKALARILERVGER